MRRAGLTVLVYLLVGCGRPPASPPAKAVVAPGVSASPSASARPRIAPTASCTHLAAQRLKGSAPSSWEEGLWLTNGEGALRVWYQGGYHAPYKTAVLAKDGSLSAAADVTPFSGLGEADDLAMASHAGVTAVVSSVYRSRQNADIMLALRSNGAWHKPVAVLEDPALDDSPALAFGADSIGIAFRHGAYPSAPDLSFGRVSLDGRALSGGVVERDAEAEGLALVGVKNGWLLVYTPSSALRTSRRGLVALRLDGQGHVTSRHVAVHGNALWPVAAWNGRSVGVAFRSRKQGHDTVAFVRLDTDGRPLADPVVADQHPDPLASFRPLSLVPAKNGWWLADIASFEASVIVARASEGRVVELDPGGRAIASVVVSDHDTGASLVRIAAHGAGVRGVFVEDRGHQQLRAFDVGCGKAAPPAKLDACAARTASFPTSGFVPLRGLVESTAETQGDLIVGYRPITKASYGPSAGNVLVSRMSTSGKLAWTTDLGAGYHPGVAVYRTRVGALFKPGDGRPEWLAILDAKSGAVKAKRQIAKNARDGCITATRSGWLVVSGAPYGSAHKPRLLTLGKNGALRAQHDLDDRLDACSLLPTPGGFLLAYTHSGQVSETNFLFVRKLDANGRALGAANQIEGVRFATQPALYRRGKQPVLVFEGPLGRILKVVVLDDHGNAKSQVITVAETYGMLSATLWGNEFLWSTKKELGRRGCLDKLLAP